MAARVQRFASGKASNALCDKQLLHARVEREGRGNAAELSVAWRGRSPARVYEPY